MAVRIALGKKEGDLRADEMLALTQLQAGGYRITDIGDIGQLGNTEILDLSENQIRDISSLRDLGKLRLLDLSNNQITDISPLSALPHLESLFLNHNNIRDLSPLLSLTELQSVELLSNPLTDSSKSIHVETLRSRGVQVRTDLDTLAPPDTSRPIYEERIAFIALSNRGGGALYTVKPDGSDLALLVGTVDPDQGAFSWSPDRSRIAYSYRGDIYVIAVAGGEPVKLTQSTADDGYPSWSPDGQWIAFTSDREGSFDLYVMDRTGENAVNLTHLADLSLSATRDLAGRTVWSPDSRQFAFSLFTKNALANAEIYVVNLEGQLRQLTHRPGSSFPAWSRGGDQIAFVVNGESSIDLYVMDPDGGNVAALTEDGLSSFENSPTWSLDGHRIAFAAMQGNRWNLYVADVTGSNMVGVATYPLEDVGALWDVEWSPDGARLLFQVERGGTRDLYIMEMDGGGLVQLTNTGNILSGLWSP